MNGSCSDSGQYRLWGNNRENAVEDRPLGNVVVEGSRVTRLRGIDPGGDIFSAPVPEPHAARLFGLGSLVVESGFRRR